MSNDHHDLRDHEPHDDVVEETNELREHQLDLAAVREKLASKTGKQYWRTLEELAGDPHFEQLLHREFPRQASEWDEAVDRRDFLKLMAASLAFAGLSGCGIAPEEHIVPYVKQPDGLVLGKPQFYATAMPFGADAIGVLVESHEGRPTNIQGNPDHPSSLGAVDSFVQASILESVRSRSRADPHALGGDPFLAGVYRRGAGHGVHHKNFEWCRLPHSDRDDHLAPTLSGQIQDAAEALSQR